MIKKLKTFITDMYYIKKRQIVYQTLSDKDKNELVIAIQKNKKMLVVKDRRLTSNSVCVTYKEILDVIEELEDEKRDEEKKLFDKIIRFEPNRLTYARYKIKEYTSVTNDLLLSIKDDTLVTYCIKLHTNDVIAKLKDSNRLLGDELKYVVDTINLRCSTALRLVKERI